MRAFLATFAALIAFFTLAGAACAQTMTVRIDQSARVTLPTTAKDVIVGNPSIADVAVLDGRNILVLGRGYGVTSLMVTDASGRTILSTQVVVSAPDDNRISFFRGPDVYNYACSPRCERTPMPGERGSGAGVYDQWAPAYTAYPDRARGAAGSSAQAQGGAPNSSD